MNFDVGYDVFISHASEDKAAIARPLFNALSQKGVVVWFDEMTIQVGDSLISQINNGLARSRYGIVILSKAFFDKGWPQKELGALMAMEIARGKLILPIWHEVDSETILNRFPLMADKLALRSDRGLDLLVSEILKVIFPSALSDELLKIQKLDEIKQLISDGQLKKALTLTEAIATVDRSRHLVIPRFTLEQVQVLHACTLIALNRLDGAKSYLLSQLTATGNPNLYPPYDFAMQCLLDSLEGRLPKLEGLDVRASLITRIPGIPFVIHPVLMACDVLQAGGQIKLSLDILRATPELASPNSGSRAVYFATLLTAIWELGLYADFLNETESIDGFFSGDYVLESQFICHILLRRQRCFLKLKQWNESLREQHALENMSDVVDHGIQNSVAWSRAYKVNALRRLSDNRAALEFAENYFYFYSHQCGFEIDDHAMAYLAVEAAICCQAFSDLSGVTVWVERLEALLKTRSDIYILKERLYALHSKAVVLMHTGRYDDCLSESEIIIQACHLLSSPNDFIAKVLATKGKALAWKCMFVEADNKEELLNQAQALLLKGVQLSHDAEILGALGLIQFLRGEVDEAIKSIRQAFEYGGDLWLQDEEKDSERTGEKSHLEFVVLIKDSI